MSWDGRIRRRPPLVGITGGIACGKSEVAREFKRLGAALLDADAVGHDFLAGDPDIQEAVGRVFGQEIRRKDGSIDRGALGAIVFADQAAMSQLNAIMHPPMTEWLGRAVVRIVRAGDALMIALDAAVLFEAGVADRMDFIVTVTASLENRVERLMRRDGLGQKAALARIEAQMPVEEKAALSDYVLENDGTIVDARSRGQLIYTDILEKFHGAPRHGIPARP